MNGSGPHGKPPSRVVRDVSGLMKTGGSAPRSRRKDMPFKRTPVITRNVRGGSPLPDGQYSGETLFFLRPSLNS